MVMGYCARCKDTVESSRFRKAKSGDGVGQKVCAKYVCLLWGGIRDPQREQKRAKVVRLQATDAAAAGGDANVDIPPAHPAPRVLVATDDVAAGGDASVDLPPARPGPRLLAVDRSNGERSKADRDALEALAERLDGIKGVLINGKTKELYIDAAKWTAEECSFPLTMPETAGHTDDMHAKWTTAKKKAPALHKAIVNCLNGAARRCIEHLKATRITNPKSVVTFGTPSFLLNGDGGMPHLDAVHEWQCLMALRPCAPTKVFSGSEAVNRRPLGLTEEEVQLSIGRKYAETHGPLLLPREQLEKHMKPVGGVDLMLPGDLALLPPAHVHETPQAPTGGGGLPRCMLFFTLLIRGEADPIPDGLYDPQHQVLPFDALAKLVTHNFFPSKLTSLINELLKCYIDWSSHAKFDPMYVDRLAATAPPANEEAAKALAVQVKAVLSALAKAQKTTWSLPSHWA